MDDPLLLGGDDDRKVFQQVLGLQGAPAYLRRAQRVEEAYNQLVARCQEKRESWLPIVRLRLGTLAALAGAWPNLRPWLADEAQVQLLETLQADLRPQLRIKIAVTASPRALRQALVALRDQLERFNRRWSAYLNGVDLGPVNELRAGYNRYYVLEKECAVRSPRVARLGFQPLPPLTAGDLLALWPPLPVPQLKG